MKKYIVLLAMVIIAGGILALYFVAAGKKQNDSSPEAKKAALKTTHTSAFSSIEKELRNGAQLLDVRTEEEYKAGHIKGAKLLSLQDIKAGKLPLADKDTRLYVYCRSGSRSAEAKRTLTAAGYTNVVDMGAMSNLERMEAPVER